MTDGQPGPEWPPSSAAARATVFPVGATITVEDLVEDLHPTLARLRSREPVSWLPELGGWMVTGHRPAVEILRNPDRFTVDDPRFTTAQVVGSSMLSTDGLEHHEHRGPFEPLFKPIPVADAGGRIEARVQALIDRFESEGRAELRSQLAGPLAVSVIADFLGLVHPGRRASEGGGPGTVDEELHTALLECMTTIVNEVVELENGRPATGQADTALARLEAIIASSLGAGGPGGPEPPLRHPLAPPAEALTARRLRSNVAVILFGAIETSEGMTANALFHLLAHPRAVADAADGSLPIRAVVDESLRLEPAAAVVDRYTTGAVALGDPVVTMGAREAVMVSLAGANRDPAVFERPDRFDPRRPGLGRHLAFARGPHICLGMHLARLQTEIAIGVLLDRLPGLELDMGRSLPPVGHVFRKARSVVAHW